MFLCAFIPSNKIFLVFWVVVSVNTAKMSQAQGMLSVDVALGKVEERDNHMDLKHSACSLPAQSAFQGLVL